MIIMTLAFLADAAVPSASSRKALSDCLNKQMQVAADAKTKPEELLNVLREKCAAQQTAFQQYLVQQNRNDGMAAAAAEADAKEQVQEPFDVVKDKYQDWWNEGAKKG